MAQPSSGQAVTSPRRANAPEMPYTDELRGKLAGALARLSLANVLDDDTEAVLAALDAHGLRLVDTARRQALVDERVYASALHRCHAAEARAARHAPRLIPATVWKGLPT